MKLRLLLCLLLLSLSALTPVQAQTTDIASLVPDDATYYIEIRVDDQLEANVQDLARIISTLNGATTPDEAAANLSFDEALGQLAPGMTFNDDILPWLAGKVGIAVFGEPNQYLPDFAAIIPIADADAAAEFLDQLGDEITDTRQEGDVTFYESDDYMIALTSDVAIAGTPVGVGNVRVGGSPLSENEAFIATRSALPTDSFGWGYISGSYIARQADISNDLMGSPSSGVPGFNELFEAALTLHPAQSAMEDAMLQYPALNGIGVAFDFNESRIDITTVISLDADYPAPTLPTDSAGADLLGYVPANAYGVLASYDLTASVGVGGGWFGFFFLLGPSIGNIFTDITFGLENPGQPTPTPAPTPTPIPTPTVNDLVTQAQPYIQQAEAFLGISMDDLYALISGEFVMAAFPVDNPASQNIGGALWLETSDTAELSRVLDAGMGVLSAQISSPGNTMTRDEETINGLDVVTWSIPGQDDGIVYGELADGVFFITLESSMDAVVVASHGDGVLTQSRHWPADIVAEYGSGVEVLFYSDLSGIQKLNPQSQTNSPVEAVVLNLDFRDNGLFVSHTTFTRTRE